MTEPSFLPTLPCLVVVHFNVNHKNPCLSLFQTPALVEFQRLLCIYRLICFLQQFSLSKNLFSSLRLLEDFFSRVKKWYFPQIDESKNHPIPLKYKYWKTSRGFTAKVAQFLNKTPPKGGGGKTLWRWRRRRHCNWRNPLRNRSFACP